MERGDQAQDETLDETSDEARGPRRAGNPIKYRHMLDKLERDLFAHEPPTLQVDRFVLIDQIGRGARGVVYRGHDPQLERDVAIKLLHIPDGQEHDEVGELIREARAVAKLAHPNVVTIHDAGSIASSSLLDGTCEADRFVDRCAYVVMELIEGETLREWMRREPPPTWQETVEVFIQAGQGLGAAHDVGLIHRDVKPSNIILGEDGRVRVADFGLARWTESRRPAPRAGGREDRSRAPSSELSQTGTIAGTPAYMAPEQHEGHSGDPRVDQFGLCASLYEALYGTRPFAGADAAAIAEAARAGAFEAVAQRPRVPRAIHRVVTRGLAADAAQRFASMDALVEALRRAQRPRWSRVLALALGGVAIASLGIALWTTQRSAGPSPLRCDESADDLIAEAWGDDERQRIAEAFAAIEQPYARHAHQLAQERLDDYARRWGAARARVCADESDDRSRPLRCLEARRQSLEALVAVLAEADAKTIEHTADALAQLPPIADCETDDKAPPLDPLLARASALRDAGKPAEAASLANERLASELDEETRLAWQLELAAALHEQGELDEARALWTQAHASAEALDDRTGVAAALIGQAHVTMSLGRYDEAQTLLRAAEARVPQDRRSRELQRSIVSSHMRLAFLRNDTELGRERIVELERLLDASGADGWEVAQLHFSLAAADVFQGDVERGAALLEQVHEAYLHHIGPEHPGMINVYMARSWVAGSRGQIATQLDEATLAHRLAREHLAPSSPLRIQVATNLAMVRRAAGQPLEALRELDEVVAMAELHLGERSPQLAWALYNQAITLLDLGRPSAARPVAERALSINRGAYGQADRSVAIAKLLVARARLEASDPALDELEATILAAAATLDEHPDSSTASSRVRAKLLLARVAVRRGRADDALAQLDSALDLIRAQPELRGLERLSLDIVEFELELGATDDALRTIQATLATLEPGGANTARAWIRAQCLLAHALIASGDANAAVPVAHELERALGAEPSLAWVAAARCLATLDEDPLAARAAAMFERIGSEASPSSP